MLKKKIIFPIPTYGFDPTEVAIPWKIFSDKNIEVVFATPKGKKAQADSVMLTGAKLGIWKSVLRAREDAVKAYNAMTKTKAFCRPIKYSAINEIEYDALYLESPQKT